MALSWKEVSAVQLSARACHEPKDSGLPCTSWSSVFVAASRSHATGSTKNTRNSTSTRAASGFGSFRVPRRRGEAWRRSDSFAGAGTRMAVGIEEPRSGHEHAGDDQPDHQQLHRDRRGRVHVVVLEGEVVGQLVERVVPAG